MPAITLQHETAHSELSAPDLSMPELPEGPVASDDRLREATLQRPDTVANPRRIRLR
jgi:hypothetical protein